MVKIHFNEVDFYGLTTGKQYFFRSLTNTASAVIYSISNTFRLRPERKAEGAARHSPAVMR
jgi:hypothetical protein